MIAVYRGEPFPGIKMFAGKSADELLSLKGVHATYVLYEEDGLVHISARAEGEKNIQTIMEAMGGGGHRSAAGAQIETDIEKALEKLKTLIQKEDNQ